MPGGRHYYAVGQNFAASQIGDSYKVNNYLMRIRSLILLAKKY